MKDTCASVNSRSPRWKSDSCTWYVGNTVQPQADGPVAYGLELHRGRPAMNQGVFMPDIVWVALGSGAGGALRYLVSRALVEAAPAAVHIATLTVNVIGSAVLAFLLARQAHTPMVASAYTAWTAGVLGGFTTYSSFNGELVRHLADGAPGRALVHAAVMLVACLAGGGLGWWLGLAR